LWNVCCHFFAVFISDFFPPYSFYFLFLISHSFLPLILLL
jgi:hypothetical protein